METREEGMNSSGYFSLNKDIDEGGSVKIRVLGNAIGGVGAWRDNKPLRMEKRDPSFDLSTLDPDRQGNPGKFKDFVATIIWNYDAKKIQIWEITQSTVMKQLFALHRNPDWNEDVTSFDIQVSKETAKGGNFTNYTLTGVPKSLGASLSKDVEKGFDETYVDLHALYRNENPFQKPAVCAA